ELWDPDSEEWSTLDSMRIMRVYHSAALLLPDGRVLSAGGGQGAAVPNFQNLAEIYLPSYLFKGKRPKIDTVPSEITYGSDFDINVTTTTRITKISLIRLPSVTHAMDM